MPLVNVDPRIKGDHDSIDTHLTDSYNIDAAEVAQVVEQRTENPRVSGSTPLLGTREKESPPEIPFSPGWQCGSSSAVERLLAKEEVVGSNPIFRSSRSGGIGRRDSLKNCWGATPVSVRSRPSAPGSDSQPQAGD